MNDRWRSIARAALPLSLAGSLALSGTLVLAGRPRSGNGEAAIGGLYLRVDRARWLHDPMDHGGGFAMPARMTPDMPAQGDERLHIELSAENRSGVWKSFAPGELSLRSATGETWAPAAIDLSGATTLRRREALSTRVAFDVPVAAGDVRLFWERDGERAELTAVPRDKHAPSPAPATWPKSVDALPPGDAARGEKAFSGKLACSSCHGQPRIPGTETVGPHLGGIGAVASSRAPGRSAAQYLYESMLYPDAVIAPRCARGEPCQTPSLMPSYARSMSLADIADLIAFLERASNE